MTILIRLKGRSILKSFATSTQLFQLQSDGLAKWCRRALLENTTYFRSRRVLYDEFLTLIDPPPGQRCTSIDQESFIVVKQFLTTRNEAITNDLRLAFDKTVIALTLSSKDDRPVEPQQIHMQFAQGSQRQMPLVGEDIDAGGTSFKFVPTPSQSEGGMRP